MHEIQQKILNFSNDINSNKISLREIGKLINEPHPFKVSYHLKKLEEKGFLKINKKTGEIDFLKKDTKPKNFFTLPILGLANCGQPNLFAEENLDGYIKISKNIVKTIKREDGIIVVKASGNSMNKAKINKNQNIEDGDYVIIDTKQNANSNNYVLAIVDDCATIKKMLVDSKNNLISLVAESTENHPDIFIHEDDRFMINGVVKYVIKKPIINYN